MKRKLKLKRKWYFVLGVIITIITITTINTLIAHYAEWIHRCDQEKGYTCNIFGE